ncbi:hypothetical protein R1flu_029211 [Riccia fluitans]|uniref:F-box domain-containing protein n=1 Tax=Riccia fluitans TaxID=41844 RepID=A0ABD1XPJ3_9MARC
MRSQALSTMIITEMQAGVPELEHSLWERLPPDLISRVVGKLPLKCLWLLRSVCSSWKTMIENGQIVYDGPPSKSVIFYCQPALRFYCEAGELKEGCSESCFVTVADCCEISVEQSVLMAAGGGLLCFTCFSTKRPDTLVIYNPLTQKWRGLKVPSPVFPIVGDDEAIFIEDFYHLVLVGLFVDQKTGHYKLVVAGVETDGPRETHLYDSAKMEWRTAGPVPSLPKILPDGEWRADRGISCGGNIYWHVHEEGCADDVIQGLLKFDLGMESWTFVKQSVECPIIDLHCVSHHEKLLVFRTEDEIWFPEEARESTELRI